MKNIKVFDMPYEETNKNFRDFKAFDFALYSRRNLANLRNLSFTSNFNSACN